MYPDFKELLALLNEHKVKYLIIGGYAVGVHAQPRVTKALDLLILAAPANARAIFEALAEFGAPLSTRAPGGDIISPRRALTPKDFHGSPGRNASRKRPLAGPLPSSHSGQAFAHAAFSPSAPGSRST